MDLDDDWEDGNAEGCISAIKMELDEGGQRNLPLACGLCDDKFEDTGQLQQHTLLKHAAQVGTIPFFTFLPTLSLLSHFSLPLVFPPSLSFLLSTRG